MHFLALARHSPSLDFRAEVRGYGEGEQFILPSREEYYQWHISWNGHEIEVDLLVSCDSDGDELWEVFAQQPYVSACHTNARTPSMLQRSSGRCHSTRGKQISDRIANLELIMRRVVPSSAKWQGLRRPLAIGPRRRLLGESAAASVDPLAT